jgi:hypothetical protein
MASVSSYLEQEAPAELRNALEEHNSWCRRCRVIFDTTERMLKVVGVAEPFDVPLDVSARLYARLEKILSGEGSEAN